MGNPNSTGTRFWRVKIGNELCRSKKDERKVTRPESGHV